jgi:hypothetical protein
MPRSCETILALSNPRRTHSPSCFQQDLGSFGIFDPLSASSGVHLRPNFFKISGPGGSLDTRRYP